MKINGVDNIANCARKIKFKLPNKTPEIELEVSGLPYGVEESFAKIWPEPPMRFKTIQTTKGAKQDPILNDPERDKEIRQRGIASAIYKTYLALKNDPNVEFDTVPTDKETMQQLVEEIESSGLNAGDISLINNASVKVSNLGEDIWDNLESLFA